MLQHIRAGYIKLGDAQDNLARKVKTATEQSVSIISRAIGTGDSPSVGCSHLYPTGKIWRDRMTEDPLSISQQYGRVPLNGRIYDAIKSAGINEDALTLDDLSKFDQLHYGGRAATRKLAEKAGLQPGMNVLDIGSGIGGPARTLAAEFGCKVTGLDITEEYVKVAQTLTERVGLSDLVTFRQGNALDLEFDQGTFDAVWTQNAIMNIENKYQLFQEVHRVLRINGRLALASLMAGPKDDAQFPVFWADTPAVSFLSSPGSFRPMMIGLGFEELIWKDTTQEAIEGGRKQQAASRGTAPPLGGHLLVTDLKRKAENTLRGLEGGAFRDIYAVYQRAT